MGFDLKLSNILVGDLSPGHFFVLADDIHMDVYLYTDTHLIKRNPEDTATATNCIKVKSGELVFLDDQARVFPLDDSKFRKPF